MSALALTAMLLQMITPIAIAAGLVYTALQFRAYRKAQHVANFTKLVELQMELRKMRVENPRLARVHGHDIEGLAGEEEIQFYFLNLMQMSVFEIVWFSHRNGQLPDDYFNSWVHRMKIINQEPSFRSAIRKSSMKIFHDQFEAYLRDLTKTHRD